MKKKLTFLSLMLGVVVSVQAQNATTITAPLFLPFTYYENVAHEALSLDEKTSDVNATLLNFYLKRPDLVATSESQLREQYDTPEITEPEQVVVTTPTPEITAPEEPEAPQVDVEVKKPNFWTYKGDGFLQFLQNYVSGNWYKGGESNYSMLSALTLEANYDNKSKWKWDNKLELKLGFQTSPSDTVNKFKTNEDLIRLTSKVGLQATKHWYYTLQFIGYTQFTRGLKANDRRTYSDFMSPFNLNLSLGMEYKMEWFNKRLTGTINISPLALNYRYVDRTIFINNDGSEIWFPTRHGIDPDKHHLLDFGSQFVIDYTWKLAENITWKSRMYGFTSYKRVEYEWENTFSFQFNKYISSKLFLHPRFDDNRARDDKHGYWMFKEFFSIGFNYGF
ncbi:MAG: DUF3078 domain-containing protein [Prevotella sp.]|nr:DUF3078 domain-containing protein [Prevotella sp.]MDY6248021.1 DUF3078 domain-containing protein [Prevotella sp.]